MQVGRLGDANLPEDRLGDACRRSIGPVVTAHLSERARPVSSPVSLREAGAVGWTDVAARICPDAPNPTRSAIRPDDAVGGVLNTG
jgi:hypothetical protein